MILRSILLASFVPALLMAQGGAVPIRIPDGAGSRCINGTNDAVWVTLRRLITDKSKGWFKEDTSVGLVISANVRTPASPKAISFPLMTEATMRGFSNGQVSIPIEYTIVDSMALKQDKIRYTGIQFEMTLLNKASANGWGRALQALGEVTKKLPIPANPYTQAGTYLLDFANSAISKDLEAQNKDDKNKSAAIVLNFDPTGACAAGGDFEKTGTIAVLQESGVKGANYIEVGNTQNYCWAADLTPAFVLKAAKKDPNLKCDAPTFKGQFFQVSNNYTGFFINALPASNVLGPASKKDRDDSLLRCAANGIATKDCLGSPRR